MRKLDIAAAALLIVGGLDWGLVAIADFDLVARVFGLTFGETNAASRIASTRLDSGDACLAENPNPSRKMPGISAASTHIEA